jgi:hypothetical protein
MMPLSHDRFGEAYRDSAGLNNSPRRMFAVLHGIHPDGLLEGEVKELRQSVSAHFLSDDSRRAIGFVLQSMERG